MLINEIFLDEKWSEKYKRSINCSNPKGFSQKAHCAGRKKRANEEQTLAEKKRRKKSKSKYGPVGYYGYYYGIGNGMTGAEGGDGGGGESVHESASDYEIKNLDKLDHILVDLCRMVVEGQKSDQDYGMVAAAVLDPENNLVSALNYPDAEGNRVHAERAAVQKYTQQYGEVPEGSIIITTLSPCNEHRMPDRHGSSCTDLINHLLAHKVYCGYIDPSQNDEPFDKRTFSLQETNNAKIRQLCKSFADTFLEEGCQHGQYYCSTDRKYKCRQGPKQTRNTK